MNIEYLRRKIRESDFSIVGLARKAKLTKQTIHNVLNGSHFPELDTVLEICKALNLNGTELATVLGIKGEVKDE